MKWPESLLAFMIREGKFKGNEEYVTSHVYLSPSPSSLPSSVTNFYILHSLRVVIDRDPKLFPLIISCMRGSARHINLSETYQDEFLFWLHSVSSFIGTPVAPFISILLSWLPAKRFPLLYNASRYTLCVVFLSADIDDFQTWNVSVQLSFTL